MITAAWARAQSRFAISRLPGLAHTADRIWRTCMARGKAIYSRGDPLRAGTARGMAARWEPADKPGSVEDCHSSGTRVATRLERPTRKRTRTALQDRFPGTAASLFGLAPGGVCLAAECCHRRGALLPHHFTLTRTVSGAGGIFSVALSVGSRPPGVTWHLVRRSPDFPPDAKTSSGSLADSRAHDRRCARHSQPERDAHHARGALSASDDQRVLISASGAAQRRTPPRASHR